MAKANSTPVLEPVNQKELPKPPFDFDDLFTYHPPTDEQKPKYALLDVHFVSVMNVAKVVGTQATFGQRSPQEHFERFTSAVRAYAEAIVEHCPASADRTAAIRCLRLARNAVNDILCGARQFPYGLSQAPFEVIFETELIKCRYQANAAIALGGRG